MCEETDWKRYHLHLRSQYTWISVPIKAAVDVPSINVLASLHWDSDAFLIWQTDGSFIIPTSVGEGGDHGDR